MSKIESFSELESSQLSRAMMDLVMDVRMCYLASCLTIWFFIIVVILAILCQFAIQAAKYVASTPPNTWFDFPFGSMDRKRL